MSSAIAAIVSQGGKPPAPDSQAAPEKILPPPSPGIWSQHFWAYFLQVQIDKFCLLGLFLLLLLVAIKLGSSDIGKVVFALANNVLGAYLYSIQARRFKQ